MNKLLSIALLLFLGTNVATAQANRPKKIANSIEKFYTYRVALTDKNGGKFTLKQPEKYLSQRAIERRKHQNIKVDSTDLPVSAKYIDALTKGGFNIVGRSKWNNTVLVSSTNKEIATSLRALTFVKGVMLVHTSPDSIMPGARVALDEKADKWEKSDSSVYGKAEGQVESLGVIPLHDAGFRGEGKVIAVIDGGFMNVDSIPAFNSVDIITTRSFVYPHPISIYQEAQHGTSVLSTMAINMPGAYIGTAPGASYVLLQSEDGGSESLVEQDNWAAAAEFADSIGADIINASLGYYAFDDSSTNHRYRDLDGNTTLISHTASMLAGKGIVFVGSAGNSGMSTWKKITPPGDAHDIITVGAIMPNGINATFSSVGNTADGRIKPDVMAYGAPTQVVNSKGMVARGNGTSFACPLVCGAVACLWQALPDKTAFEIIELIRNSGNQADFPDNIFGYGVPNFWKAYQTSGNK